MSKYRKKPSVFIEAFQMTKERRLNNSEWPNWLHQAWNKSIVEMGSVFCASDGSLDTETHTPLFIQTVDGTERIQWGDYIVQERGCQLYLLKLDVFEKTYEPVDE